MKVFIALAVMIMIALFLVVLWVVTTWLTHISMTKGDCEQYGYGSYKNFISQFNELDGWYHKNNHRYSLFNNDYYNHYLHAGIVKFNGKGMLMRTPMDYLVLKFYVRNYVKKNFEIGNVVKW